MRMRNVLLLLLCLDQRAFAHASNSPSPTIEPDLELPYIAPTAKRTLAIEFINNCGPIVTREDNPYFAVYDKSNGVIDPMSPNINGPSVLKIADTYYMMLAHHSGSSLRLLSAKDPCFKVDKKVLKAPVTSEDISVKSDPSINNIRLGGVNNHISDFLRGHIASPDAHVIGASLYVFAHGNTLWHNGNRAAAAADGEQNQKSILLTGNSFDSLVAEDLHSNVTAYMRMFQIAGNNYALTKRDANTGAYLYENPSHNYRDWRKSRWLLANVRHMAVLPYKEELIVVYSRVGDAPERLLWSQLRTHGSVDITRWELSEAQELLASELAYEGSDLPVSPSESGQSSEPLHELRDPYILEDVGRYYLYYTTRGELGVAAREISIKELPEGL